MKSFCISVVAGLIAVASYGQGAPGEFIASMSPEDRLSVVRTSMEIPSWHEKTFWSMYESFINKKKDVSSTSNRSLYELAQLEIKGSDAEALDKSRKMFESRMKELALLKDYYIEVGKDYNGVIALQFLQTEALLDMMESCGIYEHTKWKTYRFHPGMASIAKFDEAKKNTMAKALQLGSDQVAKFEEIYASYEFECNAVLGENYDMISIYASDPNDFTPAIAKTLGYNLLSVMERDIRLKEKYFNEFDKELGASVAARFLAWEDYYSLVSKMYAWAEQP